MTWNVIRLETGERHVLPIDDLKPHDEAAACWCRPFDEDGIWVHNSMDQREAFENGRQRN